MTDLTPPFRADHVGSLLRPRSVTEARRRFYEEKSISAEDLKAAEDAAIPDLIRMQEDVGLKAVTDGEARRSFWHYDFMGMLEGLDLDERDPEGGVQFAGVKLRPIFPTITVSDGGLSVSDQIRIRISETDDAPTITGQNPELPLIIKEEQSIEIPLEAVIVSDPDNVFPDDFTLTVVDGNDYEAMSASQLADLRLHKIGFIFQSFRFGNQAYLSGPACGFQNNQAFSVECSACWAAKILLVHGITIVHGTDLCLTLHLEM